MQIIYKRATARLSEKDNETIALWRNSFIAFYAIVFVAMAAFLAIDKDAKDHVADRGGQGARVTTSSAH